MTLYVPGSVLVPGQNSIVLLELEGVPDEQALEFVSKPDFYGPQAGSGVLPTSPWSYKERALLS